MRATGLVLMQQHVTLRLAADRGDVGRRFGYLLFTRTGGTGLITKPPFLPPSAVKAASPCCAGAFRA